MSHAEKIFDYVIERDGRAVVSGFDTPPLKWKSILDVFEATYKHEQKVTGLINKLMDKAIAESDHAAQSFLQWFVNEQVEEVDTMTTLLQTINHAGGAMLLVEDFVRRNIPHAGNGEEGED